MSRRHDSLELWLFKRFDLLVYIAWALLTLGWIYSVRCRYRLQYSSEKLPITSDNIITTEYTATEPHDEFRVKYILEWLKPHSYYPFWKKGQRDFIERKCKVNDCYVTRNRRMLKSISNFDVVIFHGPELTSKYVEKPKVRSPHQKYVFMSKESNQNYPMCYGRYNSFFNWTWSYKFDSDATFGHVTVRDKKGNIIGPNKTMHWINVKLMTPIDDKIKIKLNSKIKAAAWIVSNCNTLSRREFFVKKLQIELKRYGFEIDVYGRCEGKDCDSKNMSCVQMIEKKYYFYLSLENSFSEDYVTEKLLLALQNYAVPIVFGGANYTRFMPDGIYLNGGKLGPKALAKEMYDIINDKERYYSFFKWHNHYSYHARDESPDSDDHCRICEMLHDEALMKKTTVYKDFRKWWNKPGYCRP